MRILNAGAIAAIEAKLVMPALLVEMLLDGGALYMNHSRLDLVVNGSTYNGTHLLGQVSEISNQAAELPKLNFSMSGAPSDKVALALGEQVMNRTVRTRVALFNTASGALLDVSLRFAGVLNVMGLVDGRQSATLTVSAESGVRDLLRACNVLYSHVDQQILAPGDMAFQYTDRQVEQRVVFPALHWFQVHRT